MLETYKLYNNEIELCFDPAKHSYTANGESVTGVTTALKIIAKNAIGPWMVKMAAEYLEKNLKPGVVLDEVQVQKLIAGAKGAHRVRLEDAGNLGTMGHNWAEDYLLGKDPSMPVNKELRGIAEAVVRFVKRHDIQVINTERKLYSRELKVAGTADIIAHFEGELAVLDWKTGSGIYGEVYGQLGAYSLAYTEETGQEVKAHVAVNIRKDGDLYVGVSNSIARNETAFRSALALSRAMAEIEDERKQIIEKIR